MRVDAGSTETIRGAAEHPFWLTAGEELVHRPIAAALPAHEQAMTVPTHGGRWTEAR